MKSAFHYFLLILIALASVEFALYFEYQIKDHELSVNSYRYMKQNIQNLVFDEETQTVMPLPDKKFVFMLDEYTDVFETGKVEGLNYGVWDDSYDLSKRFNILVYGDSFTRGVGSIRPMKYRWTSLIEKSNPHISFLNRGGSGSNAKDQLANYKRIGSRVKHNIVIHAAIGTDIHESFQGCQISDVMEKLPSDIDKTDFLKVYILGPKNYSLPNEYMYGKGWKFYIVYNYYKLKERWGYDPRPRQYPHYQKIWKEVCDQLLASELYRSENEVKKLYAGLNGKVEKDCPADKICFIYNNHLMKLGNDIRVREKIVAYYTSFINEFKKEAQKNGADFFLILFPEKYHLYSTLFPHSFDEMDVNFGFETVKKYLDPEIKVLDLRQEFRRIALNEYRKGNLLYYKVDGHFNQLGYRVAAELINKELSKQLGVSSGDTQFMVNSK